MPENISLLSSVEILPFENILCNKKRPIIRYTVLIILATSMVIGNYYCYDYPLTVTSKSDNEDCLKVIFEQYIYYNAPNVLAPLVLGFLIDYYNDLKFSAVSMSSIVLLGQILFTLGSGLDHPLIISNIGRFLLGLGGECLFVVQCKFVVSWCEFPGMSYVLSLIVAFDRIGSVLNYTTTPFLLSQFCDQYTLLFGCGFCFFSFIVTLIIFCYYQPITGTNGDIQTINHERIRIKDLKQNFTIGFWLICFAYVFFYASFYQLITTLDFMYKMKLPFQTEYIYLIGSVICLIVGVLVNFIGYNLFWLLFGSIISIVSYIFLITLSNPALLITALGFTYGIQASTILPLFIYILPIRIIGTSFGILLTLQNIGNLISNFISSVLLIKYGTFVLMIYHLSLVFGQFYMICILIHWDDANDCKLNKNSCQRIFEHNLSQNDD